MGERAPTWNETGGRDETPGELLRRRRTEERYSLRALSRAIGGIAGKDRIARIERGLMPAEQVRLDEIYAFRQILKIPAEMWFEAARKSATRSQKSRRIR